MPILVGMKGRAELDVTQEYTAQAAGSGTLPVFATPWMCALMEKAAWTAIAPALANGDSSVGTSLNITHISATPVGLKVWAESEVTLVDGRRVEFRVSAYDEKGLIGEGAHTRMVVSDKRFLNKAEQKLEG
ncbi:MAG: thioesterase family protein [Lawsonibacter sp.]|nr:thioesterase family protein [Lawsonibacter sp.]